jgi:2-oxoglutarate ferredoxin oxidoreductase subunit beta
LIHVLRRNLDINILMFNNRIYGLTKGQYSPTSEVGKITKSTPVGSVDHPFHPVALALGADATFVARSIDVEGKHLQETIRRAHAHRGTSFVEILQNCNIFNDGAFESLTDKDRKADHQLVLEHGKPLVFGKHRDKGIRLGTGLRPEVVTLGNGIGESDLLVHDERDPTLAYFLSRMQPPEFPTPIGIFLAVERDTYEGAMATQLARAGSAAGDLDALFTRGDTWTVE